MEYFAFLAARISRADLKKKNVETEIEPFLKKINYIYKKMNFGERINIMSK